jgi:DNA-binding NarL/FixJ family response regulator
MIQPIKLFFVDDEALLLDSLEIFFSAVSEFVVIGKAQSAEETMDKLRELQPDLMLIDLNMPGIGGLSLIALIKSMYPQIRMLVLTTYYDEKNITTALFNGADGYILKSAGRDSIINAVKNVLSGQSVIDRKVMATIHTFLEQAVQDKEHNRYKELEQNMLLAGLTGREKEICTMVGEGRSNLEISEALHLTEGTIKNYLSNIYSKLGIRDRTALAVIMGKVSK